MMIWLIRLAPIIIGTATTLLTGIGLYNSFKEQINTLESKLYLLEEVRKQQAENNKILIDKIQDISKKYEQQNKTLLKLSRESEEVRKWLQQEIPPEIEKIIKEEKN